MKKILIYNFLFMVNVLATEQNTVYFKSKKTTGSVIKIEEPEQIIEENEEYKNIVVKKEASNSGKKAHDFKEIIENYKKSEYETFSKLSKSYVKKQEKYLSKIKNEEKQFNKQEVSTNPLIKEVRLHNYAKQIIDQTIQHTKKYNHIISKKNNERYEEQNYLDKTKKIEKKN